MTPEYRKKYFYLIELAAIAAFLVLAVLLAGRVLDGVAEQYEAIGWPIVGAMILAVGLGYIGADLVSGMVHFIFDSYGSETTPVVGKHFIAAFRIHHTDPEDITRYGFVETNGKNCLISLPVFILSLLFLNFSNLWQLLAGTFALVLTAAVFATNQFHKWAHTANLKGVPLLLQKWHLALGREHHNIHHQSPYNKYFCITTGWLNPLLTKIKFFEFILLIFKSNEYRS